MKKTTKKRLRKLANIEFVEFAEDLDNPYIQHLIVYLDNDKENICSYNLN